MVICSLTQSMSSPIDRHQRRKSCRTRNSSRRMRMMILISWYWFEVAVGVERETDSHDSHQCECHEWVSALYCAAPPGIPIGASRSDSPTTGIDLKLGADQQHSNLEMFKQDCDQVVNLFETESIGVFGLYLASHSKWIDGHCDNVDKWLIVHARAVGGCGHSKFPGCGLPGIKIYLPGVGLCTRLSWPTFYIILTSPLKTPSLENRCR